MFIAISRKSVQERSREEEGGCNRMWKVDASFYRLVNNAFIVFDFPGDIWKMVPEKRAALFKCLAFSVSR